MKKLFTTLLVVLMMATPAVAAKKNRLYFSLSVEPEHCMLQNMCFYEVPQDKQSYYKKFQSFASSYLLFTTRLDF